MRIESEWEKRKRRKEKIEAKKLQPTKTELNKRKNKHRFIQNTAKKLRTNVPKSEIWALEKLKEAGLTKYFLSNVQLNDVIPDFLNLEYKIVLEIDGSIHWDNPEQLEKDIKKDAIYKSMGYSLYRIKHNDLDRMKQVIEELKVILQGSKL